ncbi:DUF4365 domain-containing protein [Chryseolinea sp. T2]|uniref:DUF4365 domain-containing protein n=1 Tax=Chryseolinea sp. T2 TaxID=3129255 RepID=UPI00307708B9
MHPLTLNDIQSELSYAYLHAVASHARAGCQMAPRTLDANGIDATVTSWGPFSSGGILKEVDVKIQLKATSVEPAQTLTHFSFFVSGKKQYDDLRQNSIAVHRLLVVLFLPPSHPDWLNISENELLLKKCAYWVSLRGAPASTNESGQTVYVPKVQVFNSVNVMDLFSKISAGETLDYVAP